jgi:uncharacterized coiled-coil DUF342 family protein
MLLKAVFKPGKAVSLLLAVVILISSFSFSAFALTDAEKQEYKNQIEAIKQQIAENQAKIDALDNEASQYDGEISALQSKIDALQDKIDLYNQEIALIDKDINRVNQQISDVEAENTTVSPGFISREKAPGTKRSSRQSNPRRYSSEYVTPLYQ